MPISHVGEIAYQPASPMGGIRLQVDPPVCNRCWHEITPHNFGRASVVGQAPSPGRFEFIECTACTTARAHDAERTRFWGLHTSAEHDQPYTTETCQAGGYWTGYWMSEALSDVPERVRLVIAMASSPHDAP
jgi:hypothetical protein